MKKTKYDYFYVGFICGVVITIIATLILVSVAGAEERTCREQCTFDDELNWNCFQACIEVKGDPYDINYNLPTPEVFMMAKDCRWEYMSIQEVDLIKWLNNGWEFERAYVYAHSYWWSRVTGYPVERVTDKCTKIIIKRRVCD